MHLRMHAFSPLTDAMPIWLSVLFLGFVEGVTEFLPVSSTGHLLIAERWLPRQTDLFNIVIQCGAVLAVVPIPVFRARIGKMLRMGPEGRLYAGKVLVAFGITGAGGLVLDKMGFRLPETLLPVALALLIVGVLLVVVERVIRDKPARDEITWLVAAVVGAGQLVAAVFPGTSRSGATILLMLLLGVSRTAATEFTFLVGIPTILAAGGFKIFKALHHAAPDAPAESWSMVALGFVVSAAVSFVVVKWLMAYIRTHTFTAFGYYRIVLAGLIFGLLFTA